MKVVKNQATNDKAAQQQTPSFRNPYISWHVSFFCTDFPRMENPLASGAVVCQRLNQPEHVSSAEDHVKLWTVHLRSSFGHHCGLTETRLLQQKLSWKKGRTEEMRLYQVLYSIFLTML